MNITVSLFGQMITFIIFVFVTMKYVWPPIMKAMEERQKKIADGLMAAEEGEHKLELAQKKASDVLRDAKRQAADLLDEARQRGNQIVDEHKHKAAEEAQRLAERARSDIEQEKIEAQSQLLRKVSDISVQIAEKVIESHVSATDHAHLIDELISQIEKAESRESA